jgi:Spy/CpxP family protein refolding chaperone
MNKSTKIIKNISLIIGFSLISTMSTAAKEHSHASKSKDPNIRNKALTSKVWWNQKNKYEKISITEIQRKKMDKILLGYLEHQPKDVAAEKKAYKNLSKALTAGGKEITKAQKHKVLKITETAIGRQIDMMSKALNILTLEQRKIIQEKFPLLNSKLWVRSGNPSSFQLGKKERKSKKKSNKNQGHSH